MRKLGLKLDGVNLYSLFFSLALELIALYSLVFLLSEMGDNARKRLQLFATQFEQKINQHRNVSNNQNGFLRGGLGGANDTAAERRGLLDDEEDTIEFEMRKNK